MHRSQKPFAGSRKRRSPATKGTRPWRLERRLAVEPLEARHLLATVSLLAGDLVITDSTGSTNDALTVLSDNVNQRFEISDPGNLLTTTIPGATGSGTNTVQVPFAAVTGNQLTVNTQSGLDTVMIGGQFGVSATIDTGGNDGSTDVVNLNVDATFATDRSLSASADTINIGADADIVTSGTGTITLAARNLDINGTATLVAASTVTITVQSFETGRGILVGSENPGAALSVTDAELDRITADTTRIVTLDGQISVSGAITHANHLSLISTGTGSINIGFAITMATDKNFDAAVETAGPFGLQRVSLSSANADVTTSGTGSISLAAAESVDMVSGASLTTEHGGIAISANGGATGTISVGIDLAGTITSTGTGNISITGHGSQAGGVRIEGTIQSTSAANSPAQGKILIDGVNGSNGVNPHGVTIRNAGLVSSDGGDIEIIGQGGTGDIPLGVSFRNTTSSPTGGVRARNSASISITGTGGVGNAPIGVDFSRDTGNNSISSENGSITIRGTGGSTATGSFPYGVYLSTRVGTAPSVHSSNGDIEIVGVAGNASDTGDGSNGVIVDGGTVSAMNEGSISITGTGGLGEDAKGVSVGLFRSTSIITETGDINIQGTGGNTTTGINNQGVTIGTTQAGGVVRSSSGNISIVGTGGMSNSGNHGVHLQALTAAPNNTLIETIGGSIVIDAIAGTGTGSFATFTESNQNDATIKAEGGTLTVIGDSFERSGSGFFDRLTPGLGALTFVPKTPGLPISLGGADVLAGDKILGLSNHDLQGSLSNGYVIGDSASGDISIDANIAPQNFPTFSHGYELVTGGNIVFNAALSTVSSVSAGTLGAILLSPGPNGVVKPLASPTDVTTQTGATVFATSFAEGSDLAINIEGTTLNTEYDQLRAVGAVDLTGADLVLSGSFVSALNDVFTIVSATSVSGQFNDLPENCSIIHNGRSLRVNYTATTVTLTDVGQPPTIDVDAASVSTGEGSPVTNAGTFNDPDGNATATVTANIGTVTQDNDLGTWSWSLDTTDGPDGPFEVTITVTDIWCAMDTVTFEYTVENLPPTLTNAGNVTVGEGQLATNTGTWGDPGVDDVTLAASIGAIIQNGDGTWSWSFATPDGPDQSQTVTITATDSDGAASQTTFQLTVNNVPPNVTALDGPSEIVRGGTATFSGQFTDPGDDAWHAEAEIERAGEEPVVVPVTLQPDKTFSFQYQFVTAGMYDVTVTVFDDEASAPVSQTVMINVFPPGDYDRNGQVEPADHAFWKQNYGATSGAGLQADGNGDGSVDTADYVVWRKNLGMPGAASVVNIADEPAKTLAADAAIGGNIGSASVVELAAHDDIDEAPTIAQPVAEPQSASSKTPAAVERAAGFGRMAWPMERRSEWAQSTSKSLRPAPPRPAILDDGLLLALALRRPIFEQELLAGPTGATRDKSPAPSQQSKLTDAVWAALDFREVWTLKR